jgi:hypothetical protein
MHFDVLLHVRDHAKVVGPAWALLIKIALHVNRATGEAFELNVDRLAYQLHVTPQWIRQLLHTLIDAGELLVERSRGRYPNVYRIPIEHCPACQARHTPPPPSEANPQVELRVEPSPEPSPAPQAPIPPEPNPKLPPPQPETNPKVESAPEAPPARIAPLKDVTDVKKKEIKNNVNVAERRWEPCAPAIDAAHTEGFLDQVAEALQDWKPLSRRTYRQHVAEFGEAVMWRLVCYVREAYIEGQVKTSPGRYYMGVVRAERARAAAG